MSKAYSYQRFSSPKQMEGDSLRRQIAKARRYAQQHKLTLSDLTFRDLGVSAFRGKNATEGALAAFLKAVDDGTVEPGSFLLVESLDRLSRDRLMPALIRFNDLLERGVIVVTLIDGQRYDAESINSLTGLIVPLSIMSRANEESTTKSDRGQEVWAHKKEVARATGKMTTSSVPTWLDVRDGKVVENKAKAAVVRRIFAMTLEGQGKQLIAKTLNKEGVAPFGRGRGWTESYVRLLLNNPAVTGLFQPMKNIHKDDKPVRVPDGDPIPGYFPRIITDAIFDRAASLRTGVSGKAAHPPRNPLAGVVSCQECGGVMYFVNKGSGNLYLACDNSRRLHTCKAKSVPYWPIFDEVMAEIDNLRLYQRTNGAAKARALEIETETATIHKTRELLKNLAADLEESGGDSPTIVKLITTNERRLADAKKRKASLEARNDDAFATAGFPPASVFENPVSAFLLMRDDNHAALSPDEMVAAVGQINAEIKRQVERIFVAKGTPTTVIPKID